MPLHRQGSERCISPRSRANTDSYPPNEPYILLGDLIVRIGSCDGHNDPLSKGEATMGIANDAGTKLLAFLSMYKATICNTV